MLQDSEITILGSLGVPADQARPPAGLAGDTYAVRPNCEQLTWLYLPAETASWQAFTLHPDQGRLIWHDWVIPYGNAGTRLDALKAGSSAGICKMEGATTPLLTHEEVRQLISQSTAGTSAVAPANWGGIAMVAVGSALLVFAVIAHATKRKEPTEDTAQFEAFARSFRGGSNDPRS